MAASWLIWKEFEGKDTLSSQYFLHPLCLTARACLSDRTGMWHGKRPCHTWSTTMEITAEVTMTGSRSWLEPNETSPASNTWGPNTYRYHNSATMLINHHTSLNHMDLSPAARSWTARLSFSVGLNWFPRPRQDYRRSSWFLPTSSWSCHLVWTWRAKKWNNF